VIYIDEGIISKQKNAYSDLKDLILLTENEIKRDNWAKASQLWRTEAEIKERIKRLSPVKNSSSLSTSSVTKEELSGLITDIKEVKEKIDAMICLMNNCLAKEKQDRMVLQKTRVTINAYKRHFIPSPRFIQKKF